MEGEGKRQWGKVQNGSNRFVPLMLCFFPPFLPADSPFNFSPFSICDTFFPICYMWASFREWLQWLFHSTFDISVPVPVHSGRICGL